MSERITVALGERSYDIHVGAGLLGDAGKMLSPLARGFIPVVTDSTVASLYLEPFCASLARDGVATKPIILAPGEQTKNFAELEHLSSRLLQTGMDRGGLIVALGGGVIGDLTGLAAGLYKRGIDFAQVPTTLLAQVDSSVGGKTAINMPEGKNLIGLFHQPRIVIADIEVLRSLPRRELLAGYAEVVKCGALGDANFFEWLDNHAELALAGDQSALTRLIARAVRMKAEIVARDEREGGERALLNLGHTFGHALEATTGYSEKLLHGEAVAIGMVLAFRLSARLGYASSTDVERLEHHLRKVGLPVDVSDVTSEQPQVDSLIAHVLHDKKMRNGKLTLVLVRGIGQAFRSPDVPLSSVHEILSR